VASIKIAKRIAAELTAKAGSDYDAGLTAYGDPRPLGVHGNALSLWATGDTRRDLAFKSDGGTKVRAVLGTPYAKYLIGKYQILPNRTLPVNWQKLLEQWAEYELDQHMEAG